MDKFLSQAYLQAKKAYKKGEVPVGAVIVKDGKIIARAYNKRESKQNSLYHAEVLAINKACKKLGSFRLENCQMYVTLEPCPMCAGAIVNSRLSSVFVGCSDNNFGCCGGKINMLDGSFGYKVDIHNLNDNKCKELIDNFFDGVRAKSKIKKLLGKEVLVNNAQNHYYTTINNQNYPVYVLSPLSNKVVAVVDYLEKNQIELIVGKEDIAQEEIIKIITEHKNGELIKIFMTGKTIIINN